jgi:ABC-type transport system involved in Fe-S cluster assembly fused permease/ATPase subunit
VQGGHVRIAGQDIRTVTQSSVRHCVGIVPQDTVLFNDTVAYNIAYGQPGATQEQVVAAAKAARIHDFIEPRPRAMPRAWASAASSSRAVKSSVWRLRAPCSRTRRS